MRDIRRAILISCFALAVYSLSSYNAHAALIRRLSVEEMCLRADMVFEGRHLGNGRCQIERLYKYAAGPPLTEFAIQVNQLVDLPKAVAQNWLEEPQPLLANRIVLFLEFNDGSQTWKPIGTRSKHASGLVWIDDDRCYWFHQINNPGPALLLPSNLAIGGPKSPKDLGLEIQAALKVASEWRELIQSRRSLKEARQLAKYLVYRTSPASDKYFYSRMAIRYLTDDNRQNLLALTEVLSNANPKDDVSKVVEALGDLEDGAESAVPLLVELIGKENMHQQKLIYALQKIGCRAALPALKKLANGDNADLASRASRAIERIEKSVESSQE